ncbi:MULTISPECIES: hypothetical protein [unclassified Mesorhizobium]|uniref:hypothetical protein n=1 Tax=unclassified Mesorhizobium TaxID=325217 RepID=UPI000FE7222B|nr:MULTISPECIES: hypothetical protein [unclassified Mesorhizobium]RWK90843.1 MAG: hypothetical protein EOR45_28065 [Mesorhizobium sp.]
MKIPSIANPDLVTVADNRPRWNQADHRRLGFHNFHTTARYAMSLCAPRVLLLRKQIDWTIGERPEVAPLPRHAAFLGLRRGA